MKPKNLKAKKKEILDRFDKEIFAYEMKDGSVGVSPSEAIQFLSEALDQMAESILELISQDQGWEESRDYYARKLGLPMKYTQNKPTKPCANGKKIKLR